MSSPERVLDAVVALAPPIIAKVVRTPTMGFCIAATLTGLEVLRYFGIEGHPQAVSVRLYNRVYVELQEQGADAAAMQAAGAKVLLVGVPGCPGPVRDGTGWDGHLVIRVGAGAETRVLDLSLTQFKRPAHQILVPPGALLRWPEFPEPCGWRISDDDTPAASGSLLILAPSDDAAWKRSKDVKRVRRGDHVYRWVIGEIIRAVREKVQSIPARQ